MQPPKGFLQLKEAFLSSYSISDSSSGNRKSRCLCRKYARYSLPLVDAPSDDAAVQQRSLGIPNFFPVPRETAKTKLAHLI